MATLYDTAPGERLPRKCTECGHMFVPLSPTQKYCRNPCKHKPASKRKVWQRKDIRDELAKEVHCRKCSRPFLRRMRKQTQCSDCYAASRTGHIETSTLHHALEAARAMNEGDRVQLRDLDKFSLTAEAHNKLAKSHSISLAPRISSKATTEAEIISLIERLPDNDPRISALQAQLEAIWRAAARNLNLKA